MCVVSWGDGGWLVSVGGGGGRGGRILWRQGRSGWLDFRAPYGRCQGCNLRGWGSWCAQVDGGC